jgi:serine/threonine protein kinase
MRFNFK